MAGQLYPRRLCIHTLSLCIPPALSIFITKINDTALGRYSMSFGVTSPDPPMPGVSTRIAFPYGSYRNISLLRLHIKQKKKILILENSIEIILLKNSLYKSYLINGPTDMQNNFPRNFIFQTVVMFCRTYKRLQFTVKVERASGIINDLYSHFIKLCH